MSYPDIEPYETGMLEVSNIHTISYECSGNPKGNPVIFIHGGPGAGTFPTYRTFFDPQKYKIILFDQRGAGKSTPRACTDENTTWDLIKDMEKLREHLEIDKWNIFGGSWGSTLALAYAQAHPDRVKSLVLRGIFTARKSELKFLYQSGASHLFPEAWEEFISIIPKTEQHDIVSAYHSQLNTPEEAVQLKAACAWSTWELSISALRTDQEHVKRIALEDWVPVVAKITNHYMANKGFLREGQLLDRREVDKIRHIPCTVIQGRYDVICPVATAWALKQVWPEIDLRIVPDAGHSMRENGIMKLLVEATDKYATDMD